jgi:hypothetical protein
MEVIGHISTVVVQNKSNLLLMIILKNAQTLQLFTVNIKTEIVYKSYQKCRDCGLGWKVLDFIIKVGSGAEVKKLMNTLYI